MALDVLGSYFLPFYLLVLHSERQLGLLSNGKRCMRCDKCGEQVIILTSSQLLICKCGEKKAPREVIEYLEDRNG